LFLYLAQYLRQSRAVAVVAIKNSVDETGVGRGDIHLRHAPYGASAMQNNPLEW
jgi:hypothetical protein